MKAQFLFLTMIALWLVACGAAPAAVPSTAEGRPVGGEGTARFQNGLAVNDQLVVELSAIPTPPAGQSYQGWLRGAGDALTSVGILTPDANGNLQLTWTDPQGHNLLSEAHRFEVTLEPTQGSEKPTGGVVYSGALGEPTLGLARNLFVQAALPGAAEGETAPDDEAYEEEHHEAEGTAPPLNTPYMVGLAAQTDVAVKHVQNAVNAAAINNLDEMRVHLEHVVNILEGSEGARFGDHNGDGVAQNPGDGFGVVGYLNATSALLPPTLQAPTQEVQAGIGTIEDKALALIAMDDTEIKAELEALEGEAERWSTGPVKQLYGLTQALLTFPIQPASAQP